MIKKHIFISILILFLLSFIYLSISLISKDSKVIDDRQLTTLVQKTNYNKEQNFERILSKEKRILSFTAQYNNLGIVSILFNNYKKINTDQVWFRLKEKGSQDWIYQEKYSTGKMSEDYYYTFGFPSIINSKNKEYIIEIESVSGTLEDSISFHSQSSFFVTKYSFPKSYLAKNIGEIIPFIGNKIKIALTYLTFLDIKEVFYKSLIFSLIIFFLFFILLKPFSKIIKNNFVILYKRKNSDLEYFKKYLKSEGFLKELLIISTFFIIFFDSAFFSPLTKTIDFSFFFLICMIFMNLIFFYLFMKVILSLKRNNLKRILNPVLIPILLFTVVRSFFLDATPRWDSAVYYQTLLNNIYKFDFSFKSFMSFNLFGHPSMGFGLLSSISQFLVPNSIFMINISNLILGVLAVLSFYYISLYFFGKKRKVEVLLLTTLFSLNPLFFSISTAFFPDYGTLVFFLIALCSFFHKKHFLSSFAFLLMIFSKETGALLYALFILFYTFIVLLRRLSSIKNSYLVNLLFAVIPGIIFSFYLMFTKGSHWKLGKTLIIDGNCLFCISFQPKHIIEIIKVMFVLNFSWIFSVFIIVTIFTIVIKKGLFSFIKNKIKDDEMLSLVFTFIGYVFFFFIYVTYVTPRYMPLCVIFLILIFYYCLVRLINNKKIRILLLFLLSFLFSIQLFLNIDPLSSKVFGTFNFGNYKGLKIGTEYFGDGLIYNTQYLYIDRLINKFNKDFNISSNDTVLIFSNRWRGFYIGGAGYDHYIDEVSHKKTFNKIGAFRPKFSNTTFSTNIYYLAFPWLEDETNSLKEIDKSYNIKNKTTIKINGYWLNAYTLTKK